MARSRFPTLIANVWTIVFALRTHIDHTCFDRSDLKALPQTRKLIFSFVTQLGKSRKE